MGQTQTAIQDIVQPFLTQIFSDESTPTLISDEISELSYERFQQLLGELNIMSKNFLDSEGKRLYFAVRKGTDSGPCWRFNVQIACVAVDPVDNKIRTFKLYNLKEFIKLFKTLQCQKNVIEQSKREAIAKATKAATDEIVEIFRPGNAMNEPTASGSSKECCICLERKPDLSLPCAHSYCTPCIEQWNEDHDTCPMCREKLESTDDGWVLSEVPEADEISKEIKISLMRLADKSPPSSPEGY